MVQKAKSGEGEGKTLIIIRCGGGGEAMVNNNAGWYKINSTTVELSPFLDVGVGFTPVWYFEPHQEGGKMPRGSIYYFSCSALAP